MTNAGPVFIIGMNGSGTTMVADCLGMHPDLYVHRFEVRVLPYFLRRLSRYGDLGTLDARRRLARDIGATRAFWQANGKRDLIVSDAQLTEPGLGGVVNALFRELASRQGKFRWGEKSPMNLAHISSLAAAFPSARFIHIIRDGRECAQSFHRRYGHEPRHTMYRWKRSIGFAREQGRALGAERYTEAQYEVLTKSPESEMRRLCEFLELRFDESIMASSMRMMDRAVINGKSEIVENSNKWQEYFSRSEISRLERIGGKCLVSLGYVSNDGGDENPSQWTMAWWSSHDRLRESLRFFRRRGWRGVPMFLRMMQAAIMQRVAGKV